MSLGPAQRWRSELVTLSTMHDDGSAWSSTRIRRLLARLVDLPCDPQRRRARSSSISQDLSPRPLR